MKHILGLLTFAFAFIYVASEVCTVNSDCIKTKCSPGTKVICQHPHGEGVTVNGGLCTCVDTVCSHTPDCYGGGAPNLNCADNQRQCYDGNCICDRFPVGK